MNLIWVRKGTSNLVKSAILLFGLCTEQKNKVTTETQFTLPA